MDRKRRIRERILAGALAMSLLSAGVVLVSDALSGTDPAIHVEGFELVVKTDASGEQSVQALVEVSATNQDLLAGISLILDYNPDYLEPSDWVTNKTFGTNGVRGDGKDFKGETTSVADPIDAADPLHHLFFHTNPELYGKTYTTATDKPVDPFLFWNNESGTADVSGSADENKLVVNAEAKQLRIDVELRQTGALIGEDGFVKQTTDANRGNTNLFYLENEEDPENRVTFGTLSFRVNDKVVEESGTDLEQRLKDMVAQFNGLAWEYDKQSSTSADPSLNADGSDKEFLFREAREGAAGETYTRQLHYLKRTATGSASKLTIKYTVVPNEQELGIYISINADDIITDAQPVLKEVTINSYQAFTDGQISDLALALQKYAEAVRVTRVSGKQADMSIYWGDPVNAPTSDTMPDDGPGMIISKAVYNAASGEWEADSTATRYRFTWTSTGFKLEEENALAPGTFSTVSDPADIYGVGADKPFDPRGGDYIINQYFTYWEASGVGGSGSAVLKTFPTPVTVTLHVTPIKVIDASVEKQQITYRNDINEVPQSYFNLDLAEAAKLTLDTTLNDVIPTMPVAWTPDVLDGTVTGEAGEGNPSYVAPPATPTGTANWPIGETSINAKTGIGDYTFTTTVLSADIQAKYPWLTTDTDYALNSVRRIVDVGRVDPGDPDSPTEQLPRYVMWAEPYEATIGDEVARLRIILARQEATWNATDEEWVWDFVDMDPDPVGGGDYKFRLTMPDDQEILAGVTSAVTWFGSAGSSYTVDRMIAYTDATKGLSNTNVYRIQISPGNLTGGSYAQKRETLRRYINLGGWYGALIQEPNETTWNDKIMAYARPRTNIYTKSYIRAAGDTLGTNEDYLFDYTGDLAGLMPFYVKSDLPTFVTLPADDSVETRYDALLGSQPGAMRQFQVEDGDSNGRWDNVSGDKGHTAPDWTAPVPADESADPPVAAVAGEVVTYGADLFARTFAYSSFGTVVNPDTASITGYPDALRDRAAVVQVEVQEESTNLPEPAKWELTLTYDQTGDNVVKYDDAQVKRVVFDNKLEGYTYQQIVTLTVTNTGNREIRGLHIEIPTMTNGPWFKLITAPPAVLPVGASATFQLTYVPNLFEGDYQNVFTTEPIHIWHDNSGPDQDGAAPVTLPDKVGGGTQDNEGFEAVIKVTKTRPYRVSVVIHPTIDDDGNSTKPMGDGWLVEGVSTDAGADTYSDVAGATVYVEGSKFWVVTRPEDEYSLLTLEEDGTARVQVYYIMDGDPDKTKVYLTEYLAAGGNSGFGTPDDSFVTQDNPERLFWGEMPDGSVTVHVHYFEPLLSKLRLSDLHAFAWDQEADAELKDPLEAAAWEENGPNPHEQPLNVKNEDGTYSTNVLFDPAKDEYIVFLKPASSGEDNFCGVSIQLRSLVTHINGIGDEDDPAKTNNKDITPNVVMRLDDASHTLVCNDTPTAYASMTPDTSTPSVHYSSVFNAPVDDTTQTSIAQTTVTITISYDGTALVPPEGLESRTYKVRFVRRMEDDEETKHIALPGNSPYGMIENDSSIAASEKAAAKAAFDVANRFDAASGYTPVQAAELTRIYWPEAWGDGKNYDKDETVLFVYQGEAFYDPGVKAIYNNAGDYIDGIPVTRRLEYVTLNTSAATLTDRFSSTTTDIVTLGTVQAVDGTIPGATMVLATDPVTVTQDGMVTEFADVTDIRPGIYQLRYIYKDYDEVTDLSFTRPLIVLSALGDVDADVTLQTADQKAIQQRFGSGKLLPYELSDSVYPEADRLLYQFRIADVNNDRNINNIDADMIRKVTKLFTDQTLTPFYKPTSYTNPVRP